MNEGAVLTTLLMCDLVASTRLVDELGDVRAAEIFARHDRLFRDLVREFGGREIDKTDGFLLLFKRPLQAVLLAQSYHRALGELAREEGIELAARVGIHLGELVLRRNSAADVARGAKPVEAEGLAKPKAARLMALATGRQTLLTQAAFEVARRSAVGQDIGAEALCWLDHGRYRFKGIDVPVRVFEVGARGEAPLVPPAGSDKAARPTDEESDVALRRWPEPPWPDRPYPLLLPYSHPALFAGRQRELEELRDLLRRPLPILGLYATSGAGKSSLLAAGLVPALRAEGHPVAFERRPDEPGLAGRLIGDLLETATDDRLAVGVEDPFAFADLMHEAEILSGQPPLLVLDQFEDLMHPDNATARARLGLLLATSVQRRGGRDDPPCRWLLAYREDFHGRVSTWLRDVLREARDRDHPAAGQLPHDLAGSDRFHSWPLPLLGAPPPGSGRSKDPAQAFREAIETPLTLVADGGRSRYPWRFAGDGAERLAGAFAKARASQPDAPLVPELQVVLAHLLKQAGKAEGSEPAVIHVPEKLEALVDQALEGHLHGALDAAFLGQTGNVARERRTRVLLALRELADAEGKRGESLQVTELASAIGDRGREILEMLARRDTRILVAIEQPDELRYALSHDRLAEVIVRAVEEEGLHDRNLDRDLLALRRFVRLNTELYLSGEREQATRVPSRHFLRIAEHAEALIRGEEREKWWAACEERRRSDRRRLAVRSAVAAVTVVLVSLGVWIWVGRLADQSDIASHFASGNVDVMLAGVEEGQRNQEVLRLVDFALPRLQLRSQDLKLIGTVAWALDYYPGRDSALADRAQALKQRVLDPLRQRHPPPEISSGEESGWIEIPGGEFWMGSEEGNPDEGPRHRVTLSAFRMLDHEVTNKELRRFIPGQEGADDLPAVGVNWYEAYVYAVWLGGRLPTEAEWEYAARAGCQHSYCDGQGHPTTLDKVAWYVENSAGKLHPVRQLEPNPWGFHDMYGNAWEWVADWYGRYSADQKVNPWGAPSGEMRVIRGGGYSSDTWMVRAASRIRFVRGIEIDFPGFRVVLPAAPND